jgi:hypothetical protein
MIVGKFISRLQLQEINFPTTIPPQYFSLFYAKKFLFLRRQTKIGV